MKWLGKRTKIVRRATLGRASATADTPVPGAHSHIAHGSGSGEAGWRVALILALVSLAIGAVGLVPLMLWRLPTQISADLLAKRLVFAVSQHTPQVVISERPIDFEALTLEKFSQLSFKPALLEVLQGGAGNRSPKKLLIVPGADVTIRGDSGLASSVNVSAVGGGRDRTGRLESLSTGTPAVVTIATVQGGLPTFSVGISGPMRSPSILPVGPVELTLQHSTMSGLVGSLRPEDTRFRVALSDSSPQFETRARAEGSLVTVTPAGRGSVSFLGKGGTSIEKIDLVIQDSRGDLESSIAGNGTISFPKYPDKKTVPVSESDALSLDEFKSMSIVALEFDQQLGLLRVKLAGTAGQIRIKSGMVTTDHRASLLDWLRNSVYFQALYALFVALVSGLLLSLHIEEVWHRVWGVFRASS